MRNNFINLLEALRGLKKNLVFLLSALGVVMAFIGAHLLNIEHPAQPPAFEPAISPYQSAVYATGMIESSQGSGINISTYAEVAAVVSKVWVREGDVVKAHQLLMTLDDSVQRENVDQLSSQVQVALGQLNELKAQPRAEVLSVVNAQHVLALSELKNLQDQYDKRQNTYEMDANAITQDALDNAMNLVLQARANEQVALRQLNLTQSGAWSYDIRNQRHQYEALQKSYAAAKALDQKYFIKAKSDGVVLSINTPVGGFVSSQGSYNPYTQGYEPVMVLSTQQSTLSVRCFVDEILISKLPLGPEMRAQMSLRGTNLKIPLKFQRIQPLVSTKIQLSNQRLEKVDLRVLPILFTFETQGLPSLYPGQMVDVYIGKQ